MAKDRSADELVTRLARAAVAELAPAELELFEETSAAYFSAPAAVRGTAARPEPLGMGVELVEAVLSGVALSVATEVVTRLGLRAAGGVGQRLRPRLSRVFRRSRPAVADGPDPAAGPAPLAALGPAETVTLRRVAVDRARALGLDEARSGLLADAILGALAAGAADAAATPAAPAAGSGTAPPAGTTSPAGTGGGPDGRPGPAVEGS
ncbi:hypothetical protein ACWEQL_01020 [Kitasatospora sp. NPDC004240]